MNFITDEIIIDMGKKLTQVEEIMILKQTFYDFCLQEVKYSFFGENDFYLGKFIVKDAYKEYSEEEKPKSMLDHLLELDSKFYDDTKKAERVLAYAKESLELIEKKKNRYCDYIYLQDLDRLNGIEVKAYYHLLVHILNGKDDDGEVIYPHRQIIPRRLIYCIKGECPLPIDGIEDNFLD